MTGVCCVIKAYLKAILLSRDHLAAGPNVFRNFIPGQDFAKSRDPEIFWDEISLTFLPGICLKFWLKNNRSPGILFPQMSGSGFDFNPRILGYPGIPHNHHCHHHHQQHLGHHKHHLADITVQPEVERAGASLWVKARVRWVHKVGGHLIRYEIVALNDVDNDDYLWKWSLGRRVHKVGIGWSFVAAIIRDTPQRKSHRKCKPHCVGWALDLTVTVWSDQKTKVELGPCRTLTGLTGHWRVEGGSGKIIRIISICPSITLSANWQDSVTWVTVDEGADDTGAVVVRRTCSKKIICFIKSSFFHVPYRKCYTLLKIFTQPATALTNMRIFVGPPCQK